MYLVGTVVLYEGEFSFDPASGLTKGLNALCSKLSLGGMHVEIRSLQLTPGLDGVRVSALMELPEAIGGIVVDVGQFEVSQSGGVHVDATVTVDEIGIPGTGWSLHDVVVSIDTFNDIYSGAGTLTIPAMVTISGSFEIYQGALNEIGVGLSGFSVPIDATGLSLTALTGAVDHLADPEPVVIYAGATVSLALTGSDRLVDFIGDIEVSQAGYIKGTLLVRYLIIADFDGFDLGQLTVILGAEGTRWEGLSAEGWFNVFDTFYGEGELHIDLDGTFQGQGVGTFALPSWLGGAQVDATVQFDNSRVRTLIPINWFTIQNVGVQFDNVWPTRRWVGWRRATSASASTRSASRTAVSGFRTGLARRTGHKAHPPSRRASCRRFHLPAPPARLPCLTKPARGARFWREPAVVEWQWRSGRWKNGRGWRSTA